MTGYLIKYGIDRCPATKNYCQAMFCHYCDFRGGEDKDSCECIFHKLEKKETEPDKHVH